MTAEDLTSLVRKHVNLVKEKAGCFNLLLSGGVDSGFLCALEKPDNIFTVRLPYGPMHDEFDSVLKIVRHLGYEDKFHVIDLDEKEFDDVMEKAVKAIGRPIPHYNIFPVYVMFRYIRDMGITDVVCGDGPDESMSGYTRHLIMNYLYNVKGIEAFDKYHPIIDRILPDPAEMYAKIIGMDLVRVKSIMSRYSLIDGMCAVDMKLMRPDMDDMTDNISKNLGVNLYRPYQYPKVDSEMFKLPPELKIYNIEFGKALLRRAASKYLPREVSWRKQKIGGPLVPVNQIKGWDLEPFDKSMYLKYQEDILNG